MTSETETAEDFLKIAQKFKLGCLLTQQQNPKTIGLSDLAKTDLQAAINTVKELDIETINILKEKIDELENLYREVNQTLESGGRIFICGCGATGRLSIVLETLWRQEVHELAIDWSEKVIAFMAGGDAALIKSIQDFEDHPEFAEQQLIELGFEENDLLIGSTEGGQTSWVIGAIWKSTCLSKRKPFILYGNTDQILKANVERSRLFIESEKIVKINCNVGYMALAGSTRMQSTTILMYAIGLSLLGCDRIRSIKYGALQWKQYAQLNVNTFLNYIKEADFSIWAQLIEHETNIYKSGLNLSYQSDPYYAVTILTDTTERSPTFSLIPFENQFQTKLNKQSWCNLKILHQHTQANQDTWEKTVQRDWQEMLGNRKIRGLNSGYWKNYDKKVTNQIILGFGLHEARSETITIEHPLRVMVESNKKEVLNIKFAKEYPLNCRLSHHSLVKIVLNNVSTLIMGRMGRYESNIMTFVKPTNYKLIDRAARYVQMLRKQWTYEEIVRGIYAIRYKIDVDQPIVIKVIQYLESQHKKQL